jgi:tetratricopeptide (TPR) repeat protein
MARWGALATLAFLAALPAPALAAGAVVDAHAEVAAALFAASATQAAAEKVADTKIAAQHSQIVTLAAKVKVGQAKQAELTAAEEGYVAELAAKDRSYAEAINAFRGAVTHITDTPEGAAALKEFNDGDEAGAIKIIGQLDDARDAALQKATDIQKAVGRRDQAQLALDAHYRDKIDTATVIGLYEQVVRLDPGVSLDWVQLTRLYMAAGRLTDAHTAADAAVKTATIDYDRAVALAALDDVLTDQGDLPGARAAIRPALEILQRLAAASPDDIRLQTDFAIGLQKAGQLVGSQSNLALARQDFEQSIAVAMHMMQSKALSPTQAGDWETLMVSDMINDGQVLTKLGERAKARQVYDAALLGARELVSLNPGNYPTERLLLATLDWRGNLRTEQGDLAGARTDHEEQIALLRQLVAADPGDRSRAANLANVLMELGEVCKLQGDAKAAMTLYKEAVDVARRVVAADPANAYDQSVLAAGLADQAEEAGALADVASAKSLIAESLGILAKLGDADPTDVGPIQDLADGYGVLGEIEEIHAEHDKAQPAYAMSVSIYRRLIEMDGANASLKTGLAEALRGLGKSLRGLGDAASARKAEAESLAILRPQLASDPDDAGLQRAVAADLSELSLLDGAAWPEAAAMWQALDKKGQLQADDRHYLTEAVQHAGPPKTP